jgi:hypothetical protein
LESNRIISSGRINSFFEDKSFLWLQSENKGAENIFYPLVLIGEPCRDRTGNLLIKRRVQAVLQHCDFTQIIDVIEVGCIANRKKTIKTNNICHILSQKRGRGERPKEE